MVLVLFALASCVHFVFLGWQRSRGQGGKGLQISLLARTETTLRSLLRKLRHPVL